MKVKVKNSSSQKSLTLGETYEEFYYEKKARGCTEATLINYSSGMQYFCKFHGFDAETPLEDIKPAHIYKWINTMSEEGLSPVSINIYLGDVRVFLNWAMEKDYTPHQFKIEKIKHQETSFKFFTDDEVEKLIARPHRNESFATWRTWTIVNWVLATGNRASTICSITIGCIDFIKSDITLPHTKNKKAQVIPLSPALATILRDYIRTWRKDEPDDSPLFPNIGNEPLTTNALRLAFKKFCSDREVSHYNIHGLRHTFARQWVKNNGNMFALQQMLGHSTLDMTRRYVKLFSDDIKTDFEKFNPLDNIRRNAKRTQVVKRTKE